MGIEQSVLTPSQSYSQNSSVDQLFPTAFDIISQTETPTTTHTQKRELSQKQSYEKMREEIQKINDVEKEAERLKRMEAEGILENERKLYIHDQVINMVTEHAMEIPFNTLHILAKPDGRFTMYGLDILQMYKETAEMTDPGSREWSEYHAYSNVYNAISSGCNVSAEISPAYAAERSFAFLHTVGEYDPQLQGTVIKEYLLKWPDTPGSLEKSLKVQQGIQYYAGLRPTPKSEIQTRTDIVESPVSFVSADPNNIDPFLKVAHISQEDIEYSHQAKYQLEQETAELLHRYYNLLTQLSHIKEKTSSEYILIKNRAQIELEGIYIIGRNIRDDLKNGTLNSFKRKSLMDSLAQFSGNDDHYYAYLSHHNSENSDKLKILGGSDCPSVSGTNGALSKFLNKKGTLDQELHTSSEVKDPSCVSCGICGKIGVEVKDGKYFCPDCDEYGPKAE